MVRINKEIYCACGCGQIANHGKWYKGHWNKGKKRPDTTLRNIISNPMGSPKAKRKSSETHKKMYILKENHPRYGTHHSETSKIQISNSKTEFYNSEKGITFSKRFSEERKGIHYSPSSEIKTNEHLSPSTEFQKGMTPWSKGKRGLMIGYKFPAGEKHPMWKNGISFEPYCPKFNNAFKEKIRDKFDRKCFLCGKPENGRRLSVHHVQYEKNCGCDDTLKCDYVPLCGSCHSRTNHNRNKWEKLISQKLQRFSL